MLLVLNNGLSKWWWKCKHFCSILDFKLSSCSEYCIILNFMCRRFLILCSILGGISCLHHLWKWNRQSIRKCRHIKCRFLGIIVIIIIGTTTPNEPRPSSEASASCPYSLQHSSNFSTPIFLASSITPSSLLSFGLPLCLLPSTTAKRTLHVGLCSSIRITCPAHFN